MPRSLYTSASPTCDTAAYATGDLIGGKLTFNDALLNIGGSGVLHSLAVASLATQTDKNLELVLFSENPASTTFTDQAAFDIADADLPKVIGCIPLDGTDHYFAFADNAVYVRSGLGIVVKANPHISSPDTTIYGALLARSDPTFASAADVTVTLHILQDL